MDQNWDFCTTCGDVEMEFQFYHELMSKKIRNILLISTPYDAWVLEEDCKLSERIVSEYRGLNLTHPPRLTWTSSVDSALEQLAKKQFDLVIFMPHATDMDDLNEGRRIKESDPSLPVLLLTHREVDFPDGRPHWFNRHFVWSGDADLLVAMVKLCEDAWNVKHDTCTAGIRVIIVVEDSPRYASSLLPILYKELVTQTQSVIEHGLNQEHRLLTMRARPKIVWAESYEEALDLYESYSAYVHGVLSDVRLPKDGQLCEDAGIQLLQAIKKVRPDIPLLVASNEPINAAKAAAIPAFFVDKNSAHLIGAAKRFVADQLGFGDFVFRRADGSELARANSLYTLEKLLFLVPNEVILIHGRRNDFSRWFFAHAEFGLACTVRPLREDDFEDVDMLRQSLAEHICKRRTQRQRGVVVTFNENEFDPTTDFMKIGRGSLGGKARGIAFLFSMLARNPKLQQKYEKNIRITAPRTLSIATKCFEEFIELNNLRYVAEADMEDEEVLKIFERALLPNWVRRKLWAYLMEIKHPLSVRSSSLLEDAQFQAYAGLYSTFMLSNDHPEPRYRMEQLERAVKRVFASTYFRAPKSFSRRVNLRTDEERMGVIIQEIVGERYGDFYYPALSGVAQSYNYYPFGRMKPEDGVVTMAMGLGRIVVDGGKCLRFSPRYPKILPQCPTTDAALRNAQTEFFALSLPGGGEETKKEGGVVVRRHVADAETDGPLSFLASTYVPEQQVLRDTAAIDGPKVLLFAPVLKHNSIPLAQAIDDVLTATQEAMGGPVEVEFAVTMDQAGQATLFLLQVRPMSPLGTLSNVTISSHEVETAFCYSEHALGNAEKTTITDVIYVRPDQFDPAKTEQIAREIGELNHKLCQANRKYVLIGPGRWGSSDPWLGIPVGWADISGVSVIVETYAENLKVEPSQGSHFFHNITTLGINYVMVPEAGASRLNWEWILDQPAKNHGDFLASIRLATPLTIKVDGRNSSCVMLA